MSKDLLVLEIWLPTIKRWGVTGQCSFDKKSLEEKAITCCYKNRVVIYGRTNDVETDGRSAVVS